eukprot:6193843-Alexandrium_andersonii.AAC.1
MLGTSCAHPLRFSGTPYSSNTAGSSSAQAGAAANAPPDDRRLHARDEAQAAEGGLEHAKWMELSL